MAVHFFSEKQSFKFLKKRNTSNWLKKVITSYHKVPGQITFIFCSDEQLLEINQSYLKHFYYTDVITFNYNADNFISGDIYISVDRIAENAKIFNESFERELHRVIVHGVLHLIGFEDKSPEEQRKMRAVEDSHLKEIIF